MGKVKEEAAPGFTLAGFSRCFSWRHFKPIKMIAGDVHLRCHQDRKFGNFLLQLLVPSDLNGSSRKTCKLVGVCPASESVTCSSSTQLVDPAQSSVGVRPGSAPESVTWSSSIQLVDPARRPFDHSLRGIVLL